MTHENERKNISSLPDNVIFRSCRCTNNYISNLMKEIDTMCDISCAGKTLNECQNHIKLFKTKDTSWSFQFLFYLMLIYSIKNVHNYK